MVIFGQNSGKAAAISVDGAPAFLTMDPPLAGGTTGVAAVSQYFDKYQASHHEDPVVLSLGSSPDDAIYGYLRHVSFNVNAQELYGQFTFTFTTVPDAFVGSGGSGSGGATSLYVVVTSIQADRESLAQISPALRDKVYLYAFGEGPGTAIVGGFIFKDACVNG